MSIATRATQNRNTTDGVRRINWPSTLRDACRRIERDAPDLVALAGSLGVGRAELQRQFTRRLGVSPKAYAATLALHRLARGANTEPTTLAAIFGAGYESSSVAYALAARSLGVTPGALRGELAIGWWMGLSELGWMLLGASERGICWLSFGDEPGALLQQLRATFPQARLHNDEARLYAWFTRVRDFVLLPRGALDLPVDIQGTAFQARVWQALREIPLGKTVSYRDLAQRIGQPSAVRAVASACARNNVSVLIPCHRVIGSDGGLAGYRWGLERKRWLIAREQAPEQGGIGAAR